MALQPSIGTVLHSRYKVERVIGQGGYGCIYLAEDQRLSGRLTAVKQVSYDSSLTPSMLQEARDQFMREATCSRGWTTPTCPKSPISFPSVIMIF